MLFSSLLPVRRFTRAATRMYLKSVMPVPNVRSQLGNGEPRYTAVSPSVISSSVHRDRAVAVDVLERVRNCPIATERVAILVALIVEDDRRHAELEHLVVVVRAAIVKSHATVLPLRGVPVRDISTPLFCTLADVLEEELLNSVRRRELPFDERVTRLLVVISEIEIEDVLPEICFESKLASRRCARA